MRHSLFVISLAPVLFLGEWASPVLAQTAVAKRPVETPIVLRISKQLVEDLTADDFVVDMPVSDQSGAVPLAGIVRTRSKVKLTLLTSKKTATCLLSVDGKAHAQLSAGQGPVTAHGQAWIPYHVETRVTFDGAKFKAHPVVSQLEVKSQLDGVYTRRNGPAARLVRRIVTQAVDDARPRLDARLYERARHKFEVEMAAMAKELVDKLNSTNKLDKMVASHFPESKSWIYHVASTNKIIFAAIGPKGAVIPAFRTLAGGAMRAPVDLWVRTTWEETLVINTALVWKSTHELLKEVLPAKMADALADDVTLATEDNWFVVTVARGAFKRTQAKTVRRPKDPTSARLANAKESAR